MKNSSRKNMRKTFGKTIDILFLSGYDTFNTQTVEEEE